MTRKDCQLIAEALEATRPDDFENGLPPVVQWQDDVKAIARRLQADNPRFDANKFYMACGGIYDL